MAAAASETWAASACAAERSVMEPTRYTRQPASPSVPAASSGASSAGGAEMRVSTRRTGASMCSSWALEVGQKKTTRYSRLSTEGSIQGTAPVDADGVKKEDHSPGPQRK